ncbi:MAG: glycosyltransferase family 4 protein [Aquisalimonadaceae bacterium]
MRILMSTDTMGGVWTYALELAGALRRHGIQVVLATMGDPVSAAQHRQVRRIRDLTLCESRYRLEWMDAPWQDVERAGRWLLQLERRYRPDVVHLNHYSHGNLDWLAPSLVVGHSCVYSWWNAVHGENPPPAWNTYHDRVRAGLHGADRVAAPSVSMLRSLLHHYGPLPDTAVVHNGGTPPLLQQAAKRHIVLAAGRCWDAAKNIEAVTRIAPGLHWPVYLAGETRHPVGGGDTDLPYVRILGLLAPESLRRWYADAAIYALPARYEPFGLSILEAALAGCAPVIGDIPSLRELWASAACFVPPDDPRALRDAINGLAEDHRRRDALARSARRQALRYSADRMARGYLTLYRDLLARNGLRAGPAMSTQG